MSIASIAPVLARIAAIESQFTAHLPSAPTPAARFDAVLTAASAEATPGPAAGTAPANDGASAAPYASMFFESGSAHGVAPQLLAALGYVESRYQTDVVSPTGKVGMMQLSPAIAASLGVDPLDPRAAIDGAASLLAAHEERFGSWELALAAYHSGAQAVQNAGGVPAEAATFVAKVMERMGMS
jgi:soluble lytic murein transglycosylase-like protein